MINGLPAGQYAYTPGETVPVVVRIEDPAQMRWGFELTARTPNGCSQAGNFSPSPNEDAAAVRIYLTNSMDNVPECPPETLQFPTHMVPKAGPGGANYEFNWMAPSEDIGPVTFAAAGNAANGNREQTGDHIYTTSAVVQPAATEPAPKPSISSGGVVVATGTPVVPSVSPNSIVTIFGQDIASEGTLVLNPVTDIDGRVGTRLADTCVEINGQPAPLFAVLPTQINLQSPTLEANVGGPVTVVVIRACGTPAENRSDPEMVDMAAVSPAFFNFVNNADGINPIAAVHQDGVTFVGPGSLAFPTTPAAPGEFVSLYATGLGATNPAFTAGEIPQSVNAENPLAEVTGDISVMIGGIVLAEGDIFYAGVAPCCAGLYQIVAKVPDAAADGNLPAVVTVNGVSSPEGPFITVARP